jgi:hypothetical protein
MNSHYDTLIIGAVHNGLVAAAYLCESRTRHKNKALVQTRTYCDVPYAGIAMYSAEAVPSGIGRLSSSNPRTCISTA